MSNRKTTVLQFILDAPRLCTILCFLLAKYINATFLLVNKVKMFGTPLNVVHRQVYKNMLTRESDEFHNHSTLFIVLPHIHFFYQFNIK